MATEASDQQEKPDTSEPSAERKAALAAAYEQQQDTDTPYKDVPIRTLGELLWIFQQRSWSGEFPLPEGSQRPNLSGADLTGANLSGASLWGANLSGADLTGANLSGARLWGANLTEAYLGRANLARAYLLDANLSGANLERADLSSTDLRRVKLRRTYLRGANLSRASLWEANLSEAILSGADLTKAKLLDARLSNSTALGDITWDSVNLSQINWEPVQHLGDDDPEHPDKSARAYRQVATQLRSQGMTEVADRFAYLAQLWQRRIMRQRLRWTNLRSLGPYLGSLLLWAIAGYGYRPARTFLAYLVVIAGFAAGFYALGQAYGPHLSVLGAVVFSVTSFHGRGFFPGGIALDDPLTVLAAGEAMIGLLIEVTFIATFTQRFFAR